MTSIEGGTMTIRVLVADDHRIMRDGLCNMLRQEDDMAVVGEANNGREAVALVKELAPDVVIMDVTMPELNGIEATRQITAGATRGRVIALSVHADRQFVAEMFKAGAAGYLLKMCAFEELASAIRLVVDGQTYLSPGVAADVMEDYTRLLPETGGSPVAILTDREREVLQLLAEGKGTKEIGLILHVSSKTIDTHRRQLMQKLNLHSLPELTKFAIREGLTPLDD